MLPRHMLLALLVATASTLVGCEKGTYLEIRFTGTVEPEIHAISADLALTRPDATIAHSRGVIRRDVPDGGDSRITLPTSAAFKLDDDEGALSIAASALGLQGEVVATADAEMTTIMHGKTWTIVMNFVPVVSANLPR